MTEVVRRVRLSCVVVDDEGVALDVPAPYLWLHADGSVTWDDQEKYLVPPRPRALQSQTAGD